MTWHTDDRRLYWEQRALDAAQEDARRKMEERKTAPAVTPEQIARGLTQRDAGKMWEAIQYSENVEYRIAEAAQSNLRRTRKDRR